MAQKKKLLGAILGRWYVPSCAQRRCPTHPSDPNDDNYLEVLDPSTHDRRGENAAIEPNTVANGIADIHARNVASDYDDYDWNPQNHVAYNSEDGDGDSSFQEDLGVEDIAKVAELLDRSVSNDTHAFTKRMLRGGKAPPSAKNTPTMKKFGDWEQT
ncbi:hypothetical protein P154DRAFT_531702 [Amniculicola lignicola CBS 123094]|uniref:Uncharacterized protein n=1 Tax=Amniculicola lignicola CBS 123094 TaxID=1392246 RepID=A0A6A5WQ40_9PLEO|nr:hypothetical protein P154DRAFT_531702 [Amniculicola lignicola CBS 123094]